MPVTPKTVVYLRPDTIGDLILFQPALSLFMQAWPAARHVLVVREGYEELAPLFPAKLEWKVARLNPFRQRPSECESGLAELLADLDARNPDLVLAPTLNRTWLEIAVAAHFRGRRSLVLGSAEVDPIFAASLRIDLGVEPARAFEETVAATPELGDAENQHRFAEIVIGRQLVRALPSVEVPSAATASAKTAAGRLGMPDGGWVAVFAGGLANVAVKAWPAAKLGEVAAWIKTAAQLPVLVLAHKSERALADEVVAAAGDHGAKKIPIWLGGDGDLPLLAGLLRESRLYVGIDTGAMHMAAAVGRPVVGVFGGGHWPRFKPSARQGVSVVQPLPCFGCNWDCPVFLARRTSLPEIGGDEAYYFDEFEPAAMRAALKHGLADYDRTQPSNRIKQRALRFSWHEAAAAYLRIYRSLYSR